MAETLLTTKKNQQKLIGAFFLSIFFSFPPNSTYCLRPVFVSLLCGGVFSFLAWWQSATSSSQSLLHHDPFHAHFTSRYAQSAQHIQHATNTHLRYATAQHVGNSPLGLRICVATVPTNTVIENKIKRKKNKQESLPSPLSSSCIDFLHPLLNITATLFFLKKKTCDSGCRR